jgi:RHS repeat-associated protein
MIVSLAVIATPIGAQSFICEASGQLKQSILAQDSWSGGNLPPQNCFDGIRTRVYTPAAGGVFYELSPAGCDPNVQACTVLARVGMTTAGNSANNQTFDSIVKVFWFNSVGSTVGSCGNVGAPISFDAFDAAMSIGFQCGSTPDPRAGVYRVQVRHTKCSSSTAFWSDETSFDLSQQNLEKIFCSLPAPPRKTSCEMCASGGGGRRASATPDSGSGGSCAAKGAGGAPEWTPAGQPGAVLRYQGRGPGENGQPFAASWRTMLGRSWSHEFAERLFPDPDESKVLLVTARGTFVDFTSLDAGSGLRKYQAVQPSDEYRRLFFDTTGGGWELHGLDGSVATFDAAGLWQATSDRNGNLWQALSYTGTQVTEVAMPDGQRDAFTYLAGRLRKITRKGTDGTTTRIWTYTFSGPDLTRIDYPDGRALLLDYDSPLGLMSRATLVSDDDSNPATPAMGTTTRIVQAWGYDAEGNVVQTWRGAADFADAAAVDKWALAFDDPADPTETTITDPLGGTTTLTFDRDPDGSGQARIVSRTGSCPSCGSGPVTTFLYSDAANPLLPTRTIDAIGVWTDFVYDAHGRVTMRIDAANDPQSDPTLPRFTEWSYDAGFPAFVASTTGPYSGVAGSRVSFRTYDGVTGDLLTRRDTGLESTQLSGSFDFETETSYNAAGRPLTIDPPGHGTADVTSFTYAVPNTNGTLADSRTDPGVGTWGYAYDAFNRRTTVTDPNGVQTVTTYDALDRVTSLTRKGAILADDLVTTSTYSPLGDLFCTKLPNGNAIQNLYDSAGRLTELRRGLGVTTPTGTSCLSISAVNFAERQFWTLDAAGHRTNEKLERGTSASSWTTHAETSWSWSTICHLDSMTQAPQETYAATTSYEYDCNGNLARAWDPLHPKASFPADPTTVYGYDAINRLTSMTQPWGGAGGGTVTTSYAYDAQDHLVAVTDGEGTTTAYEYSDRDLMTGQGSEVSGTSSYTYEEHGELVSETDGRGVTTTRTVDEADRVTLVNSPGTALDTTYAYGTSAAAFEKGRLVSITRDTDVVSYTWDRFGRMLTDGELAYTYDKNGNRTRVTYPGDLKATYTFDRMDRENSLTLQQGAGAVTTVVSAGAAYKAFGPLTSMIHPTTTSRTVTRGFDLRYSPTSITVSGNLLDWSYTVDGAGNPTAIQQSQPAAVSRSYGYQDMQYFLTSATGPWSGPLSWSYDKIGNRLTETNGALTDSYSYESNSGATGNTATLDLVSLGVSGTRDYTFDLAGYLDLVDAGANQVDFTFDAAGQLGQASRAVAGETADFFYDGRGFLRQVIATMPASGGPPGGDLPFLDGFESGDVCEWSTAVGWAGTACPTTIEMSLTALYDSSGLLHGLESEIEDPKRVLYFAGAPIAIYDAGPVPELTILTTDHLGTPIHAMDATGATTWLGGFGPFGEDYTSPSAQESGIFLRFPGQWSDAIWGGATLGAEVYYNLHRWYEPTAGRYQSNDPVVSVFPSQFQHPYTFAASNPIVYLDPLGLAVQIQDPSTRERYEQLKKCFPLFRSLATSFEHQETVWTVKDRPSGDCGTGGSTSEVNTFWVPRERPEFGNATDNCSTSLRCFVHEFYERWAIDGAGLPQSKMGAGPAHNRAKHFEQLAPVGRCCGCVESQGAGGEE